MFDFAATYHAFDRPQQELFSPVFAPGSPRDASLDNAPRRT
jgi:hypothetical protein